MASEGPVTIEQRLAALEREVARIKEQVQRNGNGHAGATGGWIERVSGSMKPFPDFEDVLELGRAIRRQEPGGAESGAGGGDAPGR